MFRGLERAEFCKELLANKTSIMKLSLGLLIGLAGTVSSAVAESPAQYTGNFHQASYGRGRDCYPQYYQNCEPSPYSADNLGAGEDGADNAPVVPFGEEDLYASNDTMATSPASIAPNMIGDLRADGGLGESSLASFSTSVPIAGGDRRFKISDNNNPLPMDRVFFNYHDFDNGVYGGDGLLYDVHRYTFGMEKTFFDGMASFEVRVPFASGLSAVQQINTATQGVEFGNITGVLKVLLFQTDTTIVSAGLAGTFATARNVHLYDGATEVGRIENEAIFLQPFIGASYMNCNGAFVTFFGQMDFDITGDGVNDPSTAPGAGEQYYNQTLLMADLAIGKWLYRDPYGCGYINGIAPVVELHYTTTTTDTDRVDNGGFTVMNPYNRVDILNILGGVHLLVGQRSMLTLTAGVPLRGNTDRYYDAEYGLRYNFYY